MDTNDEYGGQPHKLDCWILVKGGKTFYPPRMREKETKIVPRIFASKELARKKLLEHPIKLRHYVPQQAWLVVLGSDEDDGQGTQKNDRSTMGRDTDRAH